jgi:hypothetical protein
MELNVVLTPCETTSVLSAGAGNAQSSEGDRRRLVGPRAGPVRDEEYFLLACAVLFLESLYDCALCPPWQHPVVMSMAMLQDGWNGARRGPGLKRTGSFHTGLNRGARQIDLKSRFLHNFEAGGLHDDAKQERLEALEALVEHEDDEDMDEVDCGDTSSGSTRLDVSGLHGPLGSVQREGAAHGDLHLSSQVDASSLPPTSRRSAAHAHQQERAHMINDTSVQAQHKSGVCSCLGRSPLVYTKSQSLPNSPLSNSRRLERDLPQSGSQDARKRAADADSATSDVSSLQQRFKRFALACGPKSPRPVPSSHVHPHSHSSPTGTVPVGPLPENMAG